MVAWIIAMNWQWSYSTYLSHSEIHVRVWTDRYAFHFGETHHFEQWDVAYWKVLILSAVPTARFIQIRLRDRAR
jgi:hypothetical protein